MTQVIKEFIEYNIDYIEKEDWETVFRSWSMYDKDYYFDDFMNVLEQAGIDVWEKSYKIRAEILQNMAEVQFHNMSFRDDVITFEEIGRALRCLMGFEGQELVDILDTAAKSRGLIKTDKGWKNP